MFQNHTYSESKQRVEHASNTTNNEDMLIWNENIYIYIHMYQKLRRILNFGCGVFFKKVN